MALNLVFHSSCFKCNDCYIPLDIFYPLESGFYCVNILYLQKELCYYKKLNLICFKCQLPIKGQFVKATHKYHLDHFTCSECPLSLLKEDSYFERESQIYCKIHYALKFAQICCGCQDFITDEYVEIKTDSPNIKELWHQNCFTLFKVVFSFHYM